MTDAALVPSVVDLAVLARLPLDERVDALGVAWRGWKQMEVTASWAFGRALRSIRGTYQKGEWGEVLDRIGMERTKAHRLMRLGDGYGDALQIATYPTVDAAIKALGPKRLAPVEHPAPEVVEEQVEHPVEQPQHPVEQPQHPVEQEHPVEQPVEHPAPEVVEEQEHPVEHPVEEVVEEVVRGRAAGGAAGTSRHHHRGR